MRRRLVPIQPVGDKRIYCILAQTVQAPLIEAHAPNKHIGDVRHVTAVPNATITIKQPAGRLMAQQGHVVSRVRDIMTKRYIVENWGKLKKTDVFFESYCEPVTTINLRVRDSFELYHVYSALERAGIPVHPFYDHDQPDYGDVNEHVLTAIATEPVLKQDVVGLLDYLPLWKPKKIRKKPL